MKRWWLVAIALTTLLFTACRADGGSQGGSWDNTPWDQARWQ